MFTGIIEAIGTLSDITTEGTNTHYYFSSPLTAELKVDQSLAHDGVCLTVVKVTSEGYQVTAIAETLQKTNLSAWKVGKKVNLERCMSANGRFDGHIVQGHVDGIAKVVVNEMGEKWQKFVVEIPVHLKKYVVNQGSICIDGVSLTVGSIDDATSAVTLWLIPETLEKTTLGENAVGESVNIEVDVLAKYVERLLSQRADDGKLSGGGHE